MKNFGILNPMKDSTSFFCHTFQGLRPILALLLLWFQAGLLFGQSERSPNTVVNIQKSNVTFREVLNELENQTGLFFVYSKEDVDESKVISINAVNERFTSMLVDFLTPLGLTYELSGYNVVLRLSNRKFVPEVQVIRATPPDKIPVTGIVIDFYGQPIVGAGVTEIGSEYNNSTFTDLKGEFSLNVSPTGNFVVKYIGYRRQDVPVAGRHRFTIRLFEDIAKLQEIVVIGYGTQKLVNLTGSLATIPNELIVHSHRPNMSNALAGTLAGMRSNQISGRPGDDDSNLDIRGYGNPLVIVDGVERPYTRMDPNDVESVTVLKDASAAVYGFKGANGVLLITTKKGIPGKTKIQYNYNYGLQSPTSKVEMMDAVEYMTYINEANLNVGGSRLYSNQDIFQVANGTHAYFSNTDWYGALIRKDAPISQHNLNVTGGNDQTKYYLSTGYLTQDGIIKTKDEYQRFNFRSNIHTNLTKEWSVGLQFGTQIEWRDSPAEVSGEWNDSDDRFSLGVLKAMTSALPIYSVYSRNNSNYYGAVQHSVRNPVACVDRNLVGTSKRRSEVYTGQLNLTYDSPSVKGLSAKGQLAYDKTINTDKDINKSWNVYDDATDQLVNWQSINTVVEHNRQLQTVLQQYSIDYNTSLGKHDLTGMLLWEVRNSTMNWFKASGEFDVIYVPELTAANAKNLKVLGDSEKKAWAGLVGRANYVYDNRYLGEVSFRYDGSYKFAPAYRWALFPAMSLGWRISDEAFIKDNTTIFDHLKLRASYGIIGDESDAQSDNYLEGYNYPGSKYVMGTDHVVTGIRDKGLANEQFTWYKSRITDIGLDASILDNQLSLEFDWFYRKRTGLRATLQNTVPSSVGAVFAEENLNSDDNRGVELVLGSKKKLGAVRLDVKTTFSYSRRKILYQEKAEFGNAWLNWRDNKNGRWDNISWGYVALGQFQSYEDILSSPIQDNNGNLNLMPGDLKYKDVNQDGVISVLDIQPIGRGNVPDLFYGLSLNALWKGFDAIIFFQGAANYTYAFNVRSAFEQNGNGYKMYKDRWHRANPDDPESVWIPGRFPAIRTTSHNPEASSFWIRNMSYLRLKNIELGYTLPADWLKKAGMEKIRVYAAAFNWLTFASSFLNGFDPEGTNLFGQNYPQMKAFNVGLNIEF